MKPEVGKSYQLAGSDNNKDNEITILAVGEIQGMDRILALWPSNKATPFIVWTYNYDKANKNIINCMWGHYFQTLKEAVRSNHFLWSTHDEDKL